MINRFFKRKPKKEASPKPVKAAPAPAQPKGGKMSPAKKILTAEGWRRLMMKKSKK